jgi:hypothetical protein
MSGPIYISYPDNALPFFSQQKLSKFILGILDTTLCDQVCQFSPGTSVSSTNKTDRYDITEILLKVALNTITLHPPSNVILY